MCVCAYVCVWLCVLCVCMCVFRHVVGWCVCVYVCVMCEIHMWDVCVCVWCVCVCVWCVCVCVMGVIVLCSYITSQQCRSYISLFIHTYVPHTCRNTHIHTHNTHNHTHTYAHTHIHTHIKNQFCRSCIRQWFEHQKSTCPIDRKPIRYDELHKDTLVANLIGNLLCYCKNTDCKWQGKHDNLYAHM